MAIMQASLVSSVLVTILSATRTGLPTLSMAMAAGGVAWGWGAALSFYASTSRTMRSVSVGSMGLGMSVSSGASYLNHIELPHIRGA